MTAFLSFPDYFTAGGAGRNVTVSLFRICDDVFRYRIGGDRVCYVARKIHSDKVHNVLSGKSPSQLQGVDKEALPVK